MAPIISLAALSLVCFVCLAHASSEEKGKQALTEKKKRSGHCSVDAAFTWTRDGKLYFIKGE